MSDSEDEFEVFNRPLSLEASTSDLGHSSPTQSNQNRRVIPIPDNMGIQRKQRSTLQELLESQPGENVPGKVPQTRLPTPPPAQPLRLELADLQRKREQKGNEVVEGGKTHPSLKDEVQKATKQAKVGQKGAEQKSDPQVAPSA